MSRGRAPLTTALAELALRELRAHEGAAKTRAAVERAVGVLARVDDLTAITITRHGIEIQVEDGPQCAEIVEAIGDDPAPWSHQATPNRHHIWRWPASESPALVRVAWIARRAP